MEIIKLMALLSKEITVGSVAKFTGEQVGC